MVFLLEALLGSIKTGRAVSTYTGDAEADGDSETITGPPVRRRLSRTMRHSGQPVFCGVVLSDLAMAPFGVPIGRETEQKTPRQLAR